MRRVLWVLIGCASVAAAPVGTVRAGDAARGDLGPAVQAADDVDGADGVSEAGPAATGAAPVVVTTATRLPAVEVTTAKRVRHDWYAGFGFGIGGGNLQSGGGRSAAVMGLVRVGGRLTDKVALGGLVVTAFGGSNSGVSGFSNLLAEALFFPVKGRGLGIAVGLGLSSAWLRQSDGAGMLVERKTQTGGAFGLGLGYDFWLTRRFNLGLWLRGDGSGGRYGVRAAGTLGLGFSWY